MKYCRGPASFREALWQAVLALSQSAASELAGKAVDLTPSRRESVLDRHLGIFMS
jgi:hypothetical protein